MKICYVISTAEVAGGANRSLLDMINHVKKAGHECVVLGPAHGSMAEELIACGIEFKMIPFKNSVKFGNVVRNCAKYTLNLWEKQKIIKFYRNENIDLVHNNSFPTLVGMEAAYALGIPYVCHIRENIWSGLGMEFIKDSDGRRTIRNAGAIIAISDYIKKSYVEYESEGNYSVIYDGIRIDDYYEEKEILDDIIIRIGILGVINPQKGQEEAVKALEILKRRGYDKILLEIIGKDGTWNGNRAYAYNLKKYVNEKGLTSVTFIPAIDSINELKAKRRAHDINLICSRAEGLGRTTIESMLSGNLTIAANAGATPEIVKHMDNGLLYECGNPEDLADKIEYAINNRITMKKIAKNSQRYAVDRFSIEKYTDQVIELYEGLIHAKR